jgi:hypothetical protein
LDTRLSAFRFPFSFSPFFRSFLPSSLPGLTRQSMRQRSSIRLSDRIAQTASPHGPPVKPGGDEEKAPFLGIVAEASRACARDNEQACRTTGE